MIAGRTNVSIGFGLPEVKVELSPEQRFAEFLHGQGKRITPQRLRVLEAIYSHHHDFNAEDLLEHLHEAVARREVSRPTVYRTLSELVKVGIVRRIQAKLNGRSLYERQYAYPGHDHLLCEVCNRLIEFHSEDLERIGDLAAEAHRFKMHGHCMMVVGICHKCLSKKERGPP